ncbi:AEC family transporter [Hoeflea poritis]|uniref:AEC family transporter n=1 Tax=Hoeflea poritis TaxID=2993659 RepID=A0ABT4VGV3_9HYPH|nr:AEC family transporter [Hoeflea poritis]MDA4843925.1 AEC family transporter [Hoeflea poritis]
MTLTERTIEDFLVLIGLAVIAIVLRARFTIGRGEEKVFARLVTDFALPALVFTSLSLDPFSVDQIFPAILMFATVATVSLFAWVTGTAIGLAPPVLGSFVLVAGVGSSSTLGYLLIRHAFGGGESIMAKVVTMGEFGVVVPLFTFGVAFARYYGEEPDSRHDFLHSAASLLKAPVILAAVLGIAVSRLGVDPHAAPASVLFNLLAVVGGSMDVLVAFSIGLMLRPVNLRNLLPLVVLVVVLKLLLEPIVALLIGYLFQLPEIDRQLLFIEAAMPSGAIAAIVAARYGCDGVVASSLVIATYLISLLLLPLILSLGI